MKRRTYAAVVVLSALLCTGAAAPPLPAHLLPDEANTVQVFQAVSPIVVHVSTLQVQRDLFSMSTQEVATGTGTGFVWDKAGHVVTNFHVVQGASKVVVAFKDGETAEAELTGVEPRKDIAVLKVRLPQEVLAATGLSVANSTELLVGQKAIAIGSPFGLDQTLTRGTVSALGRQVDGIGGVTIRDMIQTDASINPGNSGGPLLDSRGFLIGMNTMIYSQSGSSAGIGFAVPSNTITRIVTELIKYGRVKQPGIGIVAFDESVTRRLGVEGVLIRQVVADGPAAKAGLRGTARTRRGQIILGDLVQSIDGKPVKDYDDLYQVLDTKKIGDAIRVTYVRDGKPHEASLALVDYSDAR